MKRKFIFYIAILAVCLVLSACKRDDQSDKNPDSEPTADYTIMMYGCTGGDLDEYLTYSLNQVTGYGYSEKVQFTAKVKFSIPAKTGNAALSGGTRLLTLTKEGMKNERVGSQGFRLDDPQNLANFIIDAKKRLPAKQYILILWNHGTEFEISDQLVADSYPEKVVNSRATVFDDNTGGESISIFEQEEAFKRANVKLDLLYWDVCLMHNMENICQIKDYTRYVMGAAHLTSGVGGNYALLMNLLENNSNLMDAMKEYIPAMVKHWVSGEDVDDKKLAKDLAISDMKYVDEVAQNMKQCVSSLIKYRDGLEPGSAKEMQYYQFNGTAQVGQKGPYPYYSSSYGKLYYFYYNANSVDMLSAFSRIATAVLDGQMTADVAKLKLSVDKMIPISHCAGTPNFLNRVSLGINWIDKKVFEAVHPELPIPTLEGLYSKLRFEQMVGWSRFLKTNNMYRMPTENQPSGSVQ